MINKFHNYGYKCLYNGETADDITKRKNLRSRENILDNMDSSELITNLFRISQTNNDNIKGESNDNITHYYVNKEVKNTIKS